MLHCSISWRYHALRTNVNANPYCSNVFHFRPNLNSVCACLRKGRRCDPERMRGRNTYAYVRKHTPSEDRAATFHLVRTNAQCEENEFLIHFPPQVDAVACAQQIYRYDKCDLLYMFSPQTKTCSCIMIGFPCLYEEPENGNIGSNIYRIDFKGQREIVLSSSSEKSVCPNFENQGDYYRYIPNKGLVTNVCGEMIIPYVCVKNSWYNNEYQYGSQLTCAGSASTVPGRLGLPNQEESKSEEKISRNGRSPWIYVACILSFIIAHAALMQMIKVLHRPKTQQTAVLMEELISS
eukprot:TRINITY_DN1735_c0_g1_i1.p1 TRINITY_DN1735_c0_g1~~TRINITY_DN1735_c0_g1_i1.p1  ORF type:complete len:293 (-),score=17.31 TRINITY_DN1735_c0_g1_i1:143-1021(-)